MSIPAFQSDLVPSGEDEPTFYELWQILAEGRSWIVGALLAALIAAATYLAVTPAQYEATALIKIGKIVQAEQVLGEPVQGRLVPIDQPTRLAERIAFPSFKHAVIKNLDWTGGDRFRQGIYQDSINVKPSKGGDVVELKVRGLTRDDARNSLQATIDYVASLHKIEAQPMIDSLQLKLHEISAQVKKTEKALAEFEQSARIRSQLAPGDRFSESIVHTSLENELQKRLWELKRGQTQHLEWISLSSNSDTGKLGELWVPEHPVFPKKALTLILATLGGLFLGIVAVIFRQGWKNQRLPAQPLPASR